AVDEPQLPHDGADVVVGVPAAAAEEARLELVLAEPGRLLANAFRRRSARRSRMCRARPVRVQPERRARRGAARTREPEIRVLVERRIRRTQQRDHVEAAGSVSLQRVEARPRLVAQRLLDVTGDDRDRRARHTVAHARAPRTLFAVPRDRLRPARGAVRGAEARGPPAREDRDHRRERREERHVRAGLRRERDVRAPPGRAVRLHAAAVRLVPDPGLLALRPLVAVGRPLPVPARGARGLARLRGRPSTARPHRGSRRGRDRDAQSVPHLARHAHQPRDRRPALLGIVTGLAMLGNTRLVFVPVLCAVYLAFRLPRVRATAIVCALVLVGAGVAVLPWLVRNDVNVGCFTITTDGRAMWKVNNARTYYLLSHGFWIDDIGRHFPRPPQPGRITPDEARGIYDRTHGAVELHPDECLEMRFYEHLAFQYWRQHPAGKLKLA